MCNVLISVIIPVYNTEQYLPRCVDSILAQTYSNIEILLIDDGSPDKSGDICDKYASKDNRIAVIHKDNEGVNEARITGIERCHGEYVAFLDSDDYVSKNYIEHLYSNLKKYNVAVSCCQLVNVFQDSEVDDIRSEIGYFDRSRLDSFLSTDFLYDYNKGLAGFFVGQGGKMYEKKWLHEALKAGRNLKMGEDILMLFHLMQRIPSMYISPACLYYYIQHQSQVTRRVDIDTWECLIKQWNRILESDEKRYLTEQLAYRMLRYLRSFTIKSAGEEKTLKNYSEKIRRMIVFPIMQGFLFEYDYKHLTLIDRFFLNSIKKGRYELIFILSNILTKVLTIRNYFKGAYVAS